MHCQIEIPWHLKRNSIFKLYIFLVISISSYTWLYVKKYESRVNRLSLNLKAYLTFVSSLVKVNFSCNDYTSEHATEQTGIEKDSPCASWLLLCFQSIYFLQPVVTCTVKT